MIEPRRSERYDRIQAQLCALIPERSPNLIAAMATLCRVFALSDRGLDRTTERGGAPLLPRALFCVERAIGHLRHALGCSAYWMP